MKSVSDKKRSIIVCIQNGCQKCSNQEEFIPEGCPFSILHLLDRTPIWGIREKPRRSGKTTDLIGYANSVAGNGHPVYYLTMNQMMARSISSRVDKRVICIGILGTKKTLIGFAPGYVFCDELKPTEIGWVKTEMRGSRILAAYYTR